MNDHQPVFGVPGVGPEAVGEAVAVGIVNKCFWGLRFGYRALFAGDEVGRDMSVGVDDGGDVQSCADGCVHVVERIEEVEEFVKAACSVDRGRWNVGCCWVEKSDGDDGVGGGGAEDADIRREVALFNLIECVGFVVLFVFGVAVLYGDSIAEGVVGSEPGLLQTDLFFQEIRSIKAPPVVTLLAL